MAQPHSPTAAPHSIHHSETLEVERPEGQEQDREQGHRQKRSTQTSKIKAFPQEMESQLQIPVKTKFASSAQERQRGLQASLIQIKPMDWTGIWTKYHYITQVARGGFGHIFLVLHRKSNKLQLIKETLLSGIKEVYYIFDHPNILMPLRKLYLIKTPEIGKDIVWIRLTWQECGSLWDLCSYVTRAFTETELIECARQLVDAGLYLESHQLCHGDIKPGNIVIGINGVLQLIDLHTVEVLGKARSASCVKSENYAPPEHYQAGVYSSKGDVFSVGKVLCYLVTHDFSEDFSNASWTRFSESTLDFLSQCIENDISKRPCFADLKHFFQKYKPMPELIQQLLVECSQQRHYEEVLLEVVSSSQEMIAPMNEKRLIFRKSLTLNMKITRIVHEYDCVDLSDTLLDNYLKKINDFSLASDTLSRASKSRTAKKTQNVFEGITRVKDFHTQLLEHWGKPQPNVHPHQLRVLMHQIAICEESGHEELRAQEPLLSNLLTTLSNGFMKK